jgi:hypothetical protein
MPSALSDCYSAALLESGFRTGDHQIMLWLTELFEDAAWLFAINDTAQGTRQRRWLVPGLSSLMLCLVGWLLLH